MLHGVILVGAPPALLKMYRKTAGRLYAPFGKTGSTTVAMAIADDPHADPIHACTTGPVQRWAEAVWRADPTKLEQIRRVWVADMARMATRLIDGSDKV